MKKVYLRWNRPCVYICQDIRLVPGINEVREVFFEKAKSNNGFQTRIKRGLIEVIENPLPKQRKQDVDAEESTEELTESLADHNAKKAIEEIKKCVITEKLIAWRANDDRKTVIDAIDERLEKLLGSE
ncbi:MAG: hypothetical protein GWN93_26755 [Deltaproteobacteria bacterium]|nr:hypothetical protein [Deltaproteobacteria bacterium]